MTRVMSAIPSMAAARVAASVTSLTGQQETPAVQKTSEGISPRGQMALFSGTCGRSGLLPVQARRQRREFTTLLGGATEAWPLTAKAQQPEAPVRRRSPGRSRCGKGLSEVGSVEGRNIGIEPRLAEARFDRLPALAADLVQPPSSSVCSLNTTPAGARASSFALRSLRGRGRKSSPSISLCRRWSASNTATPSAPVTS